MVRIFRGILLALVVILFTAVPVLAVSNPDSITAQSVYIFRNTLETGDWLVYLRYYVEYTVEPTEDATDTFQMALYDGATLIATIPVNYYQENIQSIYFTAAQVTALGLTWNHSYTVRIQGMPSIFTLVEDTNMDSVTVTSFHYHEADELGGIMLTEAGILATDWTLTLLESGKLNTTGATYFLKAIPSLMDMDPDIFATVSRYITATIEEQGTAYFDSTVGKVPSLDTAFANMGAIIGVSQGYVAMFSTSLLYMMFVALIYPAVKQTGPAFIAAFPVVMIVAWLGTSYDMLVFVGAIVIVSAALFGILFILGKFA